MTELLCTGPADARAHLVLAHGASGPMDSEFLNTIAAGLAESGIRTVRFEFDYVAARRNGGSRRPPPKMPVLEAEFRTLIGERDSQAPLFIGGKSMGGRIATLIGDDLFCANSIAGVICLGYPFHPVGKPQQLRTAHLTATKAPVLICQGTRDPFGTRGEIAAYDLSRRVEIEWMEDGDHDLRPRKKSGTTHEQNYQQAIDAMVHFMDRELART